MTKTGITYTIISSAGGNDLSNDTLIICQWSLKYAQKSYENLGEKLRAKFPSTSFGYSMVRSACLHDIFLGILTSMTDEINIGSLKWYSDQIFTP